MAGMSIQTQTQQDQTLLANEDDSFDFFSMAGIWEDREITLESIRQKAWRTREKLPPIDSILLNSLTSDHELGGKHESRRAHEP